MFRRPNLYTSYEDEAAILPTFTQKAFGLVSIVILFLLPFQIAMVTASTDIPILRNIPILKNGIPLVRFLGDPDWIRVMTLALIFVIGALGLNLLTGVSGQVSLGHAFFFGVGAYTAAVLGGNAGGSLWGLGLPIWIWLPGAGLGAALVGVIIAPVAVRLGGLYLAIVTLGLVFIGIHIANTNLGRKIAGDPGLGRDFPGLDFRIWKEDTPLVSMSTDGHWLWFDIASEQKRYVLIAALMLVFLLLAKNIIRTRTGRALQAIRDRDIAAEVMGVAEFKYKMIAFAVSSFFAGVAGGLFASLAGKLPATQFNLLLSVTFIAILVIGGAGSVAGALLGTFFVVLSPDLVEAFTRWLSDQIGGGGPFGLISDVVLTEGSGDFGPVSVATQTPGYPLNVFDWNQILYGVLIIVFLIFEPRGLFGIWVRLRTYWQRWPFSY
jgi:branched-chain amino acid transport system permease protein